MMLDREGYVEREHTARLEAARRVHNHDAVLLERALGILHRFGTENTGWRAVFRRWYYSDEPLRNDAANLVREAGYDTMRPIGTRLVGDPVETANGAAMRNTISGSDAADDD